MECNPCHAAGNGLTTEPLLWPQLHGPVMTCVTHSTRYDSDLTPVTRRAVGCAPLPCPSAPLPWLSPSPIGPNAEAELALNICSLLGALLCISLVLGVFLGERATAATYGSRGREGEGERESHSVH